MLKKLNNFFVICCIYFSLISCSTPEEPIVNSYDAVISLTVGNVFRYEQTWDTLTWYNEVYIDKNYVINGKLYAKIYSYYIRADSIRVYSFEEEDSPMFEQIELDYSGLVGDTVYYKRWAKGIIKSIEYIHVFGELQKVITLKDLHSDDLISKYATKFGEIESFWMGNTEKKLVYAKINGVEYRN